MVYLLLEKKVSMGSNFEGSRLLLPFVTRAGCAHPTRQASGTSGIDRYQASTIAWVYRWHVNL